LVPLFNHPENTDADGEIDELVAVPVLMFELTPVAVYISLKAQNCNAAPTPVAFPPPPDTKSLLVLESKGEHVSQGYVNGDVGADNAKRERQDASV
jgi:hypothetical protein